jgi:Family of unknown function (DUF695)
MWRFDAAIIFLMMFHTVIAAPGFYAAAEDWVVTKHEIDGKTAAVRTNIALPALATKREFGRSLKLIAPFNIHNNRPFPERLDREDLEKIEEAIENKLVDPGVAIFASIITVNNSREFLLYVNDTDQAQALAERLVLETTSHKLSFRLESDPNWDAWTKFAGDTESQ